MDVRVKTVVAGIALCLMQAAPIAESQTAPADPWYALSSRPRDFQTPRGLVGKYAIELPRDWQIVPGYGGIAFMAAEKPRNNQSSAAIVLERMQLRAPIGPADVNATLAEIEASLVRALPGVQGVEQQIKQGEGRAYIFIQYTKPGLTGVDRVVQYSIPVGATMYRLICISPDGQLPNYQQKFAHVAASFKPL